MNCMDPFGLKILVLPSGLIVDDDSGGNLGYCPILGELDPRTQKSIEGLVDLLQDKAREHLAGLLEKEIDARIIQGTRTLEEQQRLYNQGRTTPGKIVTYAKPGQSAHNYGAAYDIGIFEGGKYLPESKDYKTAGETGESLDLEWGGRFKNPDEPHFQLPNWKDYR